MNLLESAADALKTWTLQNILLLTAQLLRTTGNKFLDICLSQLTGSSHWTLYPLSLDLQNLQNILTTSIPPDLLV